MRRDGSASVIRGESRAHSLRLALNELAELLTRAWLDYELQTAEARRVPAVDAIFSQTPNPGKSVTPQIVGGPAIKKYQPSTEQMLRRIDALLAPHTGEGEVPSSKH